jgi:NAD(P)-dependent dehydrogenase (short-subunit alcohol dehydrogenase family)
MLIGGTMSRVIVVTGAGQGIGREIALKVGERGDIAVVIDKNPEQAESTENLIRQRGFTGSSYCADLTQPEEVTRVFGQIFKSNHRIDALINNAGYYLPRPVEELEVGFWDLVINANMKTAFLCSLEAFKYMKAANYGKIVNMSSGTVMVSSPGLCPYIAAKAGVIGLTRALAKDLGPYNITVNAVAPGLVATEYALQTFGQERFNKVRGSKAIGRDQQPADLVGVIFFLIDSASDYMTGQTLLVDGGQAFI